MADGQTIPAPPYDEREMAFISVLGEFERRYGGLLITQPALVKEARKWFDLSLGDCDGTGWLHRDRWGTQPSDEDDGKSLPEYPPEDGDHSVNGQRKFRKHMRHLAQCMGREARYLSKDTELTREMLARLILAVMRRSHTNGCRPMMPDTDCRCDPIKDDTKRQPVQVNVPKVCEKIVEMHRAEAGQVGHSTAAATESS